MPLSTAEETRRFAQEPHRFQAFEQNLRHIVELARAREITPLLATIVWDASRFRTGVLPHYDEAAVDQAVKRNNATILCRQYAQIIRNNSGISDAEKIAAGVRPINPDREPLYAPGTQPSLEIVSSTNGAMTLEYKDMLEMSKSKPVGAVSLQLYVFVGEEMTTDPDAARFIGNYTKNPVIVAFEHSENGQQATFFSRWQGRRGDVGPWSSPISQAIAA